MSYRIFPYEFKWVIAVILFEDSKCAFRERNTQTLLFGIVELQFVKHLEVILIASSWGDGDLVVFSDLDSVYFGDELDLLLGLLV